jgi:hypothetical protein
MNINKNLNNNNENLYNNNGNIYIINKIEELIPRKEETLYMKEANQNEDSINIMFASEKGFNIMMTVSKFITFKQLFQNYMDRLGLPYYHIGVNIQFTFNQRRLNPNSEVQIGEILQNNSKIDVLDLGGLQGALN